MTAAEAQFKVAILDDYQKVAGEPLANSATAATPKGAELAWLFSGLLGIASVLLVAGRIMASSNDSGSNSNEPSGNQANQQAPSGMAWIDAGRNWRATSLAG